MNIELGIQNVAKAVTFESDETADEIGKKIGEAMALSSVIDLTDTKGRRILVPAKALGYAIVGSETKHAVGFGNL